MRSRNFCVTHNNYTELSVPRYKQLYEENIIRYAIFGEEVGEKGTPHLQGYIQLEKPKTITAFQKVLKAKGIRTSIRIARGDYLSNHNYCSKDQKVTEFGEPKKQGQRTDIEDLYKDIKAGKNDYYLQENHTKTYAKYYKAVDRMRNNIRQQEAVSSLKKEYETVKFRLWQEDLLKSLKNQTDRQVDWVVDTQGNKGKTFLAKYLMCEKEAFYVQGGKTQDIAYAYNYEKIVVFDFTRSQQEFVNYSVIESFKNGIIFSPKYESITKKFESCKVLCLSNWAPDLSKLSMDRWKLFHI